VAPEVVAGLKEHRSQRNVIFDPRGDDAAWSRYAKRECHVVAWPPPTGAPVLDDVFSGLRL